MDPNVNSMIPVSKICNENANRSIIKPFWVAQYAIPKPRVSPTWDMKRLI